MCLQCWGGINSLPPPLPCLTPFHSLLWVLGAQGTGVFTVAVSTNQQPVSAALCACREKFGMIDRQRCLCSKLPTRQTPGNLFSRCFCQNLRPIQWSFPDLAPVVFTIIHSFIHTPCSQCHHPVCVQGCGVVPLPPNLCHLPVNDRHCQPGHSAERPQDQHL